jgi:rhodanese-related sulfurtransferase
MSFSHRQPAEAHALLATGAGWILVDVRTVEEFDGGHVPDAWNVPLAFKGLLGMDPNPRFLAAMQRLFPSDARLVLT